MDIIVGTIIDSVRNKRYAKFLEILRDKKFFDQIEDLSTLWDRVKLAKEKFQASVEPFSPKSNASILSSDNVSCNSMALTDSRRRNSPSTISDNNISLVSKIATASKTYYDYFRSGRVFQDMLSKIALWMASFLIRIYFPSGAFSNIRQ